MSYRILFILLTFYCLPSFAQGEPPLDLENPRPLILQDGYNLDEDYSEADKTPAFMRQTNETSGDELTEHCAKLKREYDSLKGKPQRRWALKERYKAECQAYFDLHQ